MERLFADVAALAAPHSQFFFDFLHLDVLEGRTAAFGYNNTAKVSNKNTEFSPNCHMSLHKCQAACLPSKIAFVGLRPRPHFKVLFQLSFAV